VFVIIPPNILSNGDEAGRRIDVKVIPGMNIQRLRDVLITVGKLKTCRAEAERESENKNLEYASGLSPLSDERGVFVV
jgi:hypothetical protein